jgi:hypothetical protein
LFYDRKEYPQIERGEELVLAGFMGCFLLGIIFHCYQSGFERDPSLYSIDGAVWNGWFTSPPFSTPKR